MNPIRLKPMLTVDNTMLRLPFYLAIFSLLSFSGCSSNHYYQDSEVSLHTSGYYGLLDHISSYYPHGISLNFRGYIVGIEETSRRHILEADDVLLMDESVLSSGYSVERFAKTLKFQLPFVSHIVRYEGNPYGEGNCALYNLYHYNGSALINPCNNDKRSLPPDYDNYSSAFNDSWTAMEILKENLIKDLDTNSYTHLIVAVMGLDTAQEEAIRNYRSIISSIRSNAGDSFKPLFVGITWPSYFANRWFDPLWEVLAYPPIADRADTLGLTWVGVLLSQVVKPLSERISVSVIAHSFGARSASMGLCVGPVIQHERDQSIKPNNHWEVDNFIGLAPAFSMKRFVNEDYLFYENVYYRDYCPMINRFVFTASDHDGAFSALFWTDAVGDTKIMKSYCNQEHEVTVSCTTAESDGSIDDFTRSANITYIDTSNLMKYSMPGTHGGGHSDIYRPEIGKLLWSVINDTQ